MFDRRRLMAGLAVAPLAWAAGARAQTGSPTPLSGIEITTPDLEPFREATQSVYDKHADTIGADLIDAIRNA